MLCQICQVRNASFEKNLNKRAKSHYTSRISYRLIKGGCAMVELSWQQVLAFWMQRHFLEIRAARGDLSAVVSRICGLHAQVMSSAELAAWARIDGLDSGDVTDALWQKRELVKIWAMRWTLHLFSTDDFRSEERRVVKGSWARGAGYRE